MEVTAEPRIDINFDAAEIFLRQAREAFETGDRVCFIAARKMVAIALQLDGGPPVRIHTSHLKEP